MNARSWYKRPKLAFFVFAAVTVCLIACAIRIELGESNDRRSTVFTVESQTGIEDRRNDAYTAMHKAVPENPLQRKRTTGVAASPAAMIQSAMPSRLAYVREGAMSSGTTIPAALKNANSKPISVAVYPSAFKNSGKYTVGAQ